MAIMAMMFHGRDARPTLAPGLSVFRFIARLDNYAMAVDSG
jgi:hypothetical protein